VAASLALSQAGPRSGSGGAHAALIFVVALTIALVSFWSVLPFRDVGLQVLMAK
jgi:hypothetical protein